MVLLALVTQGADAVWPQPKEIEGGKGVATLSPTFKLKLTAGGPLMQKATDRYSHLIDQRTVSRTSLIPSRRRRGPTSGGELKPVCRAPPRPHTEGRSLVARRLLTEDALDVLEVKVEQAEAEAELQLMADESYSLVVNPSSSSLTAPTVWGALRGLETFYQVAALLMSRVWRFGA